MRGPKFNTFKNSVGAMAPTPIWSGEPDRFVSFLLGREKKVIWFARLRGVAVERHSDASYIISYILSS